MELKATSVSSWFVWWCEFFFVIVEMEEAVVFLSYTLSIEFNQLCHLVAKSVAKRSSVFDDPTREIGELTAVIKQEISGLNTALIDLQAVRNSHNDERNISRDTTTHSATVVDDLKNRLMDTTKEFKDVLTLRTEVRFFLLRNDSFILFLVIWC